MFSFRAILWRCNVFRSPTKSALCTFTDEVLLDSFVEAWMQFKYKSWHRSMCFDSQMKFITKVDHQQNRCVSGGRLMVWQQAGRLWALQEEKTQAKRKVRWGGGGGGGGWGGGELAASSGLFVSLADAFAELLLSLWNSSLSNRTCAETAAVHTKPLTTLLLLSAHWTDLGEEGGLVGVGGSRFCYRCSLRRCISAITSLFLLPVYLASRSREDSACKAAFILKYLCNILFTLIPHYKKKKTIYVNVLLWVI